MLTACRDWQRLQPSTKILKKNNIITLYQNVKFTLKVFNQ